jgi:hypothetical protein
MPDSTPALETLPESTALVVVDAQQAFDDAWWGPRTNPDCDRNIAALVSAFSAAGRPLVYVRHDSDEDESPLRPDRPGNALKPYMLEHTPDVLVSKRSTPPSMATPTSTRGCGRTPSARRARRHHHQPLRRDHRPGGRQPRVRRVVPPGRDAHLRPGRTDGTTMTADELARATATSIHEEFATVVRTEQVLDALSGRPGGRAPRTEQ